MFRALADATRRDIFERVIGEGLSVSTLAHDYEMSFAAVQKHVSVLERAALVTKERHGREQIVHGNLADAPSGGGPARRLRRDLDRKGHEDRRDSRRERKCSNDSHFIQ